MRGGSGCGFNCWSVFTPSIFFPPPNFLPRAAFVFFVATSFSFAVGSINLARTLRFFSFDQILPQGSGGKVLSVFFASIFFEPFRRLIGLFAFLVAMSVVAPFTANYWLAVFLVRGCECKAGAVWPECSCVRRSVAFSGRYAEKLPVDKPAHALPSLNYSPPVDFFSRLAGDCRWTSYRSRPRF